jgi:hypothetical protein
MIVGVTIWRRQQQQQQQNNLSQMTIPKKGK